jgi:hypothetical protein
VTLIQINVADFSLCFPFSSREGVRRFGVEDNFCRATSGAASNMSVMFVGAIVALVSRDGHRWFAAFAAVGDWDVRHRGSGAACHLVLLLKEIEVGFI